MLRYLQAARKIHPGHIGNTPLIVADLELTGLDASYNRIIAVGWTLIDGGRIQMGTNHHVMVQAPQPVGDSAIIHGLTDSEVAGGLAPATALGALFSAAVGRIWVFHHAGLDIGFLQQACMQWCGSGPPFAYLDTLQMEMSSRQKRGVTIRHGELQLPALRDKFHLPRYAAHNALSDALATAELLLAMAAHRDSGVPFPLKKQLQYA
jgi:DNA polymerase-3 subunit epsilon